MLMSPVKTMFMEDIDVSECSDSTFLPDFDGTYGALMNNSEILDVKPKVECGIVKDEVAFDDRLRQAARKSESENSLTPVIKEELRCFINAKRHKEGKKEIMVEFKEPTQHPLTPEEIRKKEKRREQNRRAATKCRKKKKLAKISKETEMNSLREVNSNLQRQVRTLNRELRLLTQAVTEHEQSGHCRIAPMTPFLNTSVYSQLEAQFHDELNTSDAYSPCSPNSLFQSSSGICGAQPDDYSGYPNQFSSSLTIPLELPGSLSQTQPTVALNGTLSLTPPVSPYFTEFPDNGVMDPQLSDILHGVDYNNLLQD